MKNTFKTILRIVLVLSCSQAWGAEPPAKRQKTQLEQKKSKTIIVKMELLTCGCHACEASDDTVHRHICNADRKKDKNQKCLKTKHYNPKKIHEMTITKHTNNRGKNKYILPCCGYEILTQRNIGMVKQLITTHMNKEHKQESTNQLPVAAAAAAAAADPNISKSPQAPSTPDGIQAESLDGSYGELPDTPGDAFAHESPQAPLTPAHPEEELADASDDEFEKYLIETVLERNSKKQSDPNIEDSGFADRIF